MKKKLLFFPLILINTNLTFFVPQCVNNSFACVSTNNLIPYSTVS